MSDDLIKDEAEFIRNCATDIETGEPLDDDQLCNLYVIDAHRIADLIDAVEERNKELTLQLLATSGQAADALDKLTKAVDVIKCILASTYADDNVGYHVALYGAKALLAELEGEE
jgi:hypothetical protein